MLTAQIYARSPIQGKIRAIAYAGVVYLEKRLFTDNGL